MPSITAAGIRQRFANTRMPADPLDVRAAAARWPLRLQEKIAADLTPAAVLIPVVCRADSLTVLLTERSPNLTHHAGQISFPGGRMEPEDKDIRETALRETHEEVGIEPHGVEIVGYLPPNPTVTGYAVTPVVGLVTPPDTLVIDPVEVTTAFEVPLPFLLDSANAEHGEREFDGLVLPITEFKYGRYRIWGATAGMLVEFRDRLIEK